MADYSHGHNLIRIGFLTFVALVAFATLFGYATNRGFNTYADIHVRFRSAAGLERGDPVLFRGVNVGEVRGIDFGEEDAVLVEIRLTRAVPAGRDARAALVAADMFGKQSIELYQGRDNSRGLAQGDTLQGNAGEPLTARISAFSDHAEGLINKSVPDLLVDAGETMDRFRRMALQSETLASQVIRQVERQQGGLDTIMHETARLATNLSAATEPEGLLRVRASLEETASALLRMAIRMDTTVLAVNGVLGRLEKGSGAASRILNDPAAYDAAVASLNSLDALLRDLKQNPKRYINVSVF